MEMTRQRHSESVHAAVYDECPYCKGRGKVKSALTMSVEIQRKLGEILKKRSRDESDFQLRIVVHPSVLDRLRNEDEKHLIEMEKRYFGKLSFRADPALHAEIFKNRQCGDERRSVLTLRLNQYKAKRPAKSRGVFVEIDFISTTPADPPFVGLSPATPFCFPPARPE